MFNHLIASKKGPPKDKGTILNPMFSNPVLHEAMRIEDNEKLPVIRQSFTIKGAIFGPTKSRVKL
jgi:hypothetical protein